VRGKVRGSAGKGVDGGFGLLGGCLPDQLATETASGTNDQKCRSGGHVCLVRGVRGSG